jgi:hypothetical protein
MCACVFLVNGSGWLYWFFFGMFFLPLLFHMRMQDMVVVESCGMIMTSGYAVQAWFLRIWSSYRCYTTYHRFINSGIIVVSHTIIFLNWTIS